MKIQRKVSRCVLSPATLLSSLTAPATSTADDLDNLVVKDDDPEGLKLLAVPDPLECAWRRLVSLHTHQPKLLDTWLVSFDVAIRQSKFLRA